MEQQLEAKGIPTKKYNTTCPFVEKVWNRGEQIAAKKYSLVIHGKPTHEETRATFSHASADTAAVVVNDMAEAIELGKYISGELPAETFYSTFAGRYSKGFDITKDLQKIGVINQTTMLASDTQGIADYLKQVMVNSYNLTEANVGERFADTRDTLCYATNDNQSAVYGLLQEEADLAIVVGGYNSSNTSHLVELCEEKLSTYFINDPSKIISKEQIFHFDLHEHTEKETTDFLPQKTETRILITSGASCPDAVVEKVIEKLLSFYETDISLSSLEENFK
jgi:4-hydroxy-3-methylbut-2-enyl diphosphate reductase